MTESLKANECADRIAYINEATIKFRMGVITQEQWIAVRREILGDDLAAPHIINEVTDVPTPNND